jgi:hydrogenase maturation factor
MVSQMAFLLWLAFLGVFMLGMFVGFAMQRVAHQDAEERYRNTEDLTDWDGDQ